MIAALLPYENFLDYEYNSLGTIIISKDADFFSIFSTGAIGGTLVYLSFLLSFKTKSKGKFFIHKIFQRLMQSLNIHKK